MDGLWPLQAVHLSYVSQLAQLSSHILDQKHQFAIRPDLKMSGDSKIITSVAQHSEQSFSEEPKIHPGDIQDGDLALEVLHTRFEPYTKEEEKRVLRKIDIRLALLMLLINGIQFVDKLVNNFLCANGYFANIVNRQFHKPLPMALSHKLT